MAKMRKTIFNSSPLFKGKDSLAGMGLKPIYDRITSLRKGRIWRKATMTTLGILALALLVNLGVNLKNTQAGWQPGDFLNQNFWENYDSTGNIIAALYGDGTPNSSPYSRFWT